MEGCCSYDLLAARCPENETQRNEMKPSKTLTSLRKSGNDNDDDADADDDDDNVDDDAK